MNKLLQTLKIAGKDFMEDRCMSQAAGLSFYAVTAIPPLVVIILSVIGLIFGTQESLRQIDSTKSRCCLARAWPT